MMKSRYLFTFLLLFLAFFLCYPVNTYASSDLQLENLSYEVTLQENGDAIVVENWDICLPTFPKNQMYKNMEDDKEYTLEELGL